MDEIAAGVIAGAEIELQVGAIDGDLEMAEFSVFCRIVAGEAENVIDGTVFLHLGENATEIVGVKEGFSAGIGGKRGERVLRRGVAVQIVEGGGAGVGRLSVQAGVLRFAARGKGLEAADVEGIDGGVGFNCGSGGGAQRGLVVHPGLGDAIAEIDYAFLLR